MKNFRQKLKNNSYFVVLLLVTMLVVSNAVSVKLPTSRAQDQTPGGINYPFKYAASENDSDKNNSCDVYMADFSNKLMGDYKKFIDTNFQNKSSTASLLQGGIDKYRELRTSLFTAYDQYYPNVGSYQAIAGVQPGACRAIIEKTLVDAKNILKQHAVATSGVKKSTALLEKYRQINAELSNLYQQFVYMRSYLDSFASKLTCYPKTGCIKA